MLGIIIGTLCLFAFIRVWRHRHGWGCYGYHRSWRGRRYGYHRHGGGLYHLFEELDTSPGQEKAIRGAMAELKSSFGALRPRLSETKQSVARALGEENFDGPALQQALDGQLGELSQLNDAIGQAAAKVHEALDPDQRRRLARMIGSLPFGFAY